MEKAFLRKQMINTLEQLPKKRKQKKEGLILQLLFASQAWQQASSIGVIRSLPFEFDTEAIFVQAAKENKQIAVPKTVNHGLHFFEVDMHTRYQKSAFGVEEPISEIEAKHLDLVLVPGLIFSSTGYRIGFGGGYYDRFLATYSGETISLVFSEQINDQWQPEAFDIPVNKIITDSYDPSSKGAVQ
ncbi:5-formyltetrahydrofolate cyclo-ligase [Enterococcus sp. 8G7_MSG3316]|uniref:5-formyltetrahydrofolate cyclo-ligase n=1 Tax=Candidatus Enterococcus testudinis TaxID=1834191 RepID=A0A242A7L0_9ENTE|nr:5-formyltetrahydrofolate cyclo-ligase [Enterococcus sp. 8G7_MSG3316]OTN77037.1 5-formyltetrahydrofolate cyclo-ligase [Enterococcus sp. 8G7_MSG3316]